MKPRKPAQKVSLAIAYLCYAAAVLTLLTAGYWAVVAGTGDAIFASLAASVVFLVGCGIVLHVIGAVSLPDLSFPTVSGSDEKP